MQKSTETLHKEIDLIQACIKKYDDRSLLIKGWSIALIALVCGLTTTGILFFDPNLKPISLSILLVINFLFRLIDIDNSKKKWQYIQLYNWVIKNRSFDNDKPWEFVYDLNYERFSKTLKDYKPSEFGKRIYLLTWSFILILMVWYTVTGLTKKPEPNKERPSVIINKKDSTIKNQ